jgi:4-amino-4-deoxy-L-arabinose transferase-like glycosyltransferase
VRRAEVAAVIALLAVMAGLLGWEAWGDSLTEDEGQYMRAGYCALTTGAVDLEPTNPAGYKLLAGAGIALLGPHAPVDCSDANKHRFFGTSPDTLRRLVLAGRLPFIGLSLLLAVAVFAWGRAWFGIRAGWLGLGLVALEPNLLAHGHLATGDMLLTLGTVVCLAAFWRYRAGGSGRWLWLSGAGLGLALLGKVSALALVLVLLAITLFSRRRGAVAAVRATRFPLLSVIGIGWLLVCITYLPFHTLMTPLHLPALLSWIAPPSWIYGLQYQAAHVQGGAVAYLDGQVSRGRGFAGYYIEAFAIKATIGMLLLAAAALVRGVARRDREDGLYLWLPILVTVAVATIGGIDIGVRYILPVFPLLAIAAGPLMLALIDARWTVLMLAVAVLAVASSLWQAPEHIGYFNELAGSHPEQHLADSNIDWGQDAWRLRAWWESNGRPALHSAYFGPLPLSAYGLSDSPLRLQDPPPPGWVAVSVTQLVVYSPDADPHYGILPTCGQKVGTSIYVARDLGGENCTASVPLLRR